MMNCLQNDDKIKESCNIVKGLLVQVVPRGNFSFTSPAAAILQINISVTMKHQTKTVPNTLVLNMNIPRSHLPRSRISSFNLYERCDG